MKIKRFFAADMRQAIRQVRENLGSDAVILSNKAVNDGVELVAAIDYDEAAVAAAAKGGSEVASHGGDEPPVILSDKPEKRDVPEQQGGHDKPEAVSGSAAPRMEWSQDPLLVEMRQEMQALRRMMENELSELTWRDMGERRPQTQELLRRLMGLGFGADICQKLVARAEDTDKEDVGNLEQAWRKVLYSLASVLPVAGDRLLEQGGVVAVIGPTGVGKTTTVAKLAARFCLRHGNRQVALITTDNFRIGAREQINTYARILDVPVRSAGTAEELNNALNTFCDRRLILVDTAGMSQRDVRLSEQLSLLSAGNQPVRSFLTLPATTQQAALEQAIKIFAVARPEACVLTKVDEATSLGGVLSAVIRSGLPLAYTTDGQKVPEDLHLARSHSLVSRAVAMVHEADSGQDEEYLALALGGSRADAHV